MQFLTTQHDRGPRLKKKKIITKVTKGWVKVWQCCSQISMKHKAAATSLLREVWSSQIKFWGGIRRDPLWIIETCTPNHRHFLAIKEICIYICIYKSTYTLTRQHVHTFHSRSPRSSIGPSGGRSFFCSFCTRAWRAEVATLHSPRSKGKQREKQEKRLVRLLPSVFLFEYKYPLLDSTRYYILLYISIKFHVMTC